MNKVQEYLFILSILFLQVSGFLQSNTVFSGDNVILLTGLIIILLNKRIRAVKLSQTAKIAFYFGSLHILIIPLFIQVKNILTMGMPTVIGITESTKTYFEILPFLRILIRLFLVYNFCKYLSLDLKHYKRGLNALFLFTIVITLSMLFGPFFISLGFKITTTGYAKSLDDPLRFSGLTGMLVNSTGTMLSIFFGVAMMLYKKKFISGYSLLFYSSFLIIGILLTGSRTALAITITIYLMYFSSVFRRLKRRIIVLNIAAFVVFVIIFLNFSETTLNRFQQNTDVGYGGLGLRMSYWKIFLTDLHRNPAYLFFGNFNLPLYERSPHNFYIYLVYSAGIFFFILFFYALKKLINSRTFNLKMNNGWSINPWYILVPQLLFWGTSLEPITWFGLILLLTSGIYIKNKVIL